MKLPSSKQPAQPTIEFVVTGGTGRMLDLGIARNTHTVEAYANKAELIESVRHPDVAVKLYAELAPADCVTGQ